VIPEFVARFDAARQQLLGKFKEKHPDNYGDIVRAVVEVCAAVDDYGVPDPDRITRIDHGSYQGTLVFVVAEKGYQPSQYWATVVGYGSCSGCDTLERIRGYEDGPPTEEQAKEYLTLALHILQRMRCITEESSA
jgi:hypothetical protein